MRVLEAAIHYAEMLDSLFSHTKFNLNMRKTQNLFSNYSTTLSLKEGS